MIKRLKHMKYLQNMFLFRVRMYVMPSESTAECFLFSSYKHTDNRDRQGLYLMSVRNKIEKEKIFTH